MIEGLWAKGATHSLNDLVNHLPGFEGSGRVRRYDETMQIFLLVGNQSEVTLSFPLFDRAFAPNSDFHTGFFLDTFESIPTGANKQAN